ncbi:MAG: electron transfer flavoprotein subunit beta/FixA family protein [Deltaproteobacteria bacterium]|nr:electron transfer flavoprotein subunit beta/FixA family protein [Deltaproteobacteria bacterium]
MNIVVLVKQVPDPEARVTVNEGGGPDALQVEDRWVTSFFDEIALEKALLLRSSLGGAVIALTAGGGKAVDALRRAIAFGADRAVQVDDPALGRTDALGIARVLAAAVGRLAPDLVLAGRAAGDDEAGFTGGAVAELLGWPHVDEAVELDVAECCPGLRATRVADGAKEIIDVVLPALVTAQKGLAVPRVPQVTNVMKAMRAKIEKLDLGALGLTPERLAPVAAVTGYHAPPSRPPVRMIAGPAPEAARTLVGLLRDEAKLLG